MSTIKEQQDEEREALISIYEGDLAFKEVNPLTFQYKVKIKHRVMVLVTSPSKLVAIVFGFYKKI